MLAAGLEGIREGLDPGDPQHENLYEFSDAQLAERGVQELPRTLGEAVEAFEADPFIEQVLGTELKQEFITYKRAEWEEYHQTSASGKSSNTRGSSEPSSTNTNPTKQNIK